MLKLCGHFFLHGVMLACNQVIFEADSLMMTTTIIRKSSGPT